MSTRSSRLLLCASVFIQVVSSLRASDNDYSFPSLTIPVNNFQNDYNRQIQNLNFPPQPTFEFADFQAPDLNINAQSLRLPEIRVRDLDNSAWTYQNDAYHFDGEAKRFDAYAATIHSSEAGHSVTMDLGNMKFESGRLAPISYTHTYKDDLGNTLKVERTKQTVESNPTYQQFVAHFEQSGPSPTRPADPSRELVTAYEERWMSSAGTTRLSIDSIEHNSNFDRFVSGYHGSIQDGQQKLTFTVTSPHDIDGKIESLSVEIKAPGAPIAHITWKPTDAQDAGKAFELLRNNLPIPVLVGPRSSFRINNVDIPEAPLKLSPDGSIAPKQLGDVKDLANLLGKENFGIEVSFSPPAGNSAKSGFSLMNSLRNLGYMLTGEWSEVKDMRQQLMNMQTQDPGKYLLTAGFSDPNFLSLKDMRAVFNNVHDSAPGSSNNKRQSSYVDTILSIIKTPLKLVGDVIGTILNLPGAQQVWTATRVIVGAVVGVLTGDIFDKSNPIVFDKTGPAVITINGVGTPNSKAKFLNDAVKELFGITVATRIENNTHWFRFGDVIQIITQEYGNVIDRPSLDTAKAIRVGIKEKGEVFVVAHSQGSAIFKQALSLLTPEEKNKIYYIGLGPEWVINQETDGIKSATNIFNNGDPVPVLGNKLKFISNLILPWNNGRSSTQNIEREDVAASGLKAHGFEYYEEAVRKWAQHFKEQQVYTALPSSY